MIEYYIIVLVISIIQIFILVMELMFDKIATEELEADYLEYKE